MVNKLFVSFALTMFFFGFLSCIVEGGGGMKSTQLSSSLTASATTLDVDSTNGFLDGDIVTIQNEKIKYTGRTTTTFTGCIRGYDNTNAAVHADNARVLSSEANILNEAIGVNLTSIGTEAGTFDLIGVSVQFIKGAIVHFVLWDFGFLKVFPLTILRVILMCISAGFILTIIINVGSIAANLLSGILNRLRLGA